VRAVPSQRSASCDETITRFSRCKGAKVVNYFSGTFNGDNGNDTVGQNDGTFNGGLGTDFIAANFGTCTSVETGDNSACTL
jgi:hypothetical protein